MQARCHHHRARFAGGASECGSGGAERDRGSWLWTPSSESAGCAVVRPVRVRETLADGTMEVGALRMRVRGCLSAEVECYGAALMSCSARASIDVKARPPGRSGWPGSPAASLHLDPGGFELTYSTMSRTEIVLCLACRQTPARNHETPTPVTARARNPRSPSPPPSPICRGSGMAVPSPICRGSGVHPHRSPSPICRGSGIQLSTIEYCKGVEFRSPNA